MKQHHNPYFRCPHCKGDDVYLVPPSFGDRGIYFCSTCDNKEITPEAKKQKSDVTHPGA